MRRAGGLAFIILLLLAFLVGLLVTRLSESASPTTVDEPVTNRESSSEDIDQVRQELVNAYYRTVPETVLSEPSIPEILRELDDPYTEYLSPAEFSTLKTRTARSYSGVGLTVAPSRRGLLVTSTLGGPAREAGIRRGDLIVRIQGRPAGELSFEQSLSLITGQKGTLVRLTVKRARQGTIHFALERQEIDAPSLRTRLVTGRGGKHGYI